MNLGFAQVVVCNFFYIETAVRWTYKYMSLKECGLFLGYMRFVTIFNIYNVKS